MNYCMIEIAFDNKEEVNKVVNELLDYKLVASCQVIKSDSYWNWNSKMENSVEYLLLVKTKKTLAKKIYDVIKNIHTYDCFEFAIFNLESFSDDYIKWIDEETI